ncbi:MAG: glycine dehydrogenase (aminomethyl-transferring), partial [Alphaproteobacteria bacterium]|nr:glycine dehydrogenase (aminomethyl-transferring) [Alphaproteobacteria bacterium]
MAPRTPLHALEQTDDFVHRHIGPTEADIAEMLEFLGIDSLDALIDAAVPAAIRSDRPLELPPSRAERDVLAELRRMASDNTPMRSMIGTGYYDCITPPVVLRNVLENPGWYTAYTPYQPEISQGRLEALLNFQTMNTDLTGMEMANASLLDEATAAAEAMTMCHRVGKSDSDVFFVSQDCHPQTIEVVRTRAEPLGLTVVVGDHAAGLPADGAFGLLLQYPKSTGGIEDYTALVEAAHEQGALVCVAADLLALLLLTPPGEWGADIVVGSAQRFGVPLGFGGPHAAYIATHDAYMR